MPGPLKNARHERFAQELAKGSTADAAYTAAGFRPNRGNATRLKLNESIFDRVQELKGAVVEKVVEKTAIDAAWVLQKAAELHTKALEEKALAVAKGALDLIGKHVDVQAFREQIQHSGLIEYKNLSDEEIAARIAAHETARAHVPTTH
jgi:phage terminase small subunit